MGLGEVAPRLGTIEIPVEVQALKFEVTSEIIGEGMYRFVPHIINPEAAPVSYYYHFDFGDKKEASYNKDQDITHEYQQEGTYNVVVGIGVNVPKYPPTIPRYSFSVSVGGSKFWIVKPSLPIYVKQESTFEVMTSGLLPETPYYEWDFGDNSGKIIPFSNEATHLYNEAGTYSIRVQIFDSEEEGALLLGEATTEVTVEGETVSALSFLQQTTFLLVSIVGDTTYYISDGRTGPKPGAVLNFYSNQPETIWNGTHFSHSYYRPPTESDGGIKVTIEGDVSEEADEILNLDATIIYDDSHRNPGEQREARASIRNVRLEPESPIPSTYDPRYEPHFIVYIEGPEVANYVTSTFYENKQPTASDPDFKVWYDPLEFVNTERTPLLRIEFGTSDLY